MKIRKFNENVSDLRSSFQKKTTYHCYASSFDEIIDEVYGKQISVESEEQDMYESSIDFNITGELDSNEIDMLDQFKSGEDHSYPGTGVLLNSLCRDGFIDKGEYFIHSSA